jgi:arylsulfatase A-like enzyme
MGENGYIWHAFCIQEPLIRVPLLVRYPKWFPNPRISNELVQTNDIMPTILEGLGVDWNYKNESHGKSFLNGCQRNEALIQYYNPEMMIDRWLERRHKLEKQEFKQYCRDLIGYRTLEKKFVLSSDGRHEYYNIETDSKERQNLYNKQSSECQRLEKRLTKWNETLTPHVADDKRTGFDKKTWEKMKALGYA